tara:strand:+ start:1400 stop:3265 length:1866 start_codon:yes stop_codon:yes gene_type:complete
MAEKLPLVYVDGELSQLPPGDQAEGGELGNLIAGSGLVGGGDLQTGSKRLDVALAPNPSGLIFVGDTVGMDGADLVTADAALASGNAALVDAVPALASGVAGLVDATTALASGNAALSEAANFVGSSAVILTASSTIQAGNPVGLDDAGKVAACSVSSSPNSRSYGSALNLLAAAGGYHISCYDTLNDRLITGYSRSTDNANIITVNTVSGKTITNQSQNTWATQGVQQDMVFDPSTNRVVYVYRDDGNSLYGTCKVGQVYSSATQIEFGSAVIFSSTTTTYCNAIYDSTSQRVVVSYSLLSNGGKSKVGQVTAAGLGSDTITFGAEATFTSNNPDYVVSAYDSTNDRVVVAYRDTSASSYGYAVVGNVTGGATNTISYGTPVLFQSTDTRYPAVVHDPNEDRTVIYYTDDSNNNGTARVGTVDASTNSISFPVSAVVFNSGSKDNVAIYDPVNQRHVIATNDVNNSDYGTGVVGSLSGNTISFTGTSVFASLAATYPGGIAYDPDQGVVIISYRDNSYVVAAIASGPGEAAIPTLGGVNNFIGTANSTVASGDSVKVNAPRSLNYSNAGLSTGYFYYVDPSASGFTTTATQPSSWTAGDYSWGPVAKAVSSSGLLILDTI